MEATVADRARFRRDVAAARDRFETRLRAAVPGLGVNVPPDRRLVQHSHLRFPGVPAETLLIRLDRRQVAAAAGSACHSGAGEVSHVLAAMGFDEDAAAECVRFTFGWVTTPADGDVAAERVLAALEDLP